jgi:BlaR1 peptidase M56.
LLIKTAFKKHLSALAQYLIWIIVVAKLLVPVGLESEASPWNDGYVQSKSIGNDFIPGPIIVFAINAVDGSTINPMENY